MPSPPPEPLHLSTLTSLLQTFSSFLVVAFHTIIYERSLYPPQTFLLTRAYNFPVRQSRHPKVCRWILDAVSAIETQMLKSPVRRVVFVIYSKAREVLERFVFDVDRFPVVPAREQGTEMVRDGDELGEGEEGEGDSLKGVGVNAVDVEEQLRAVVRKLAYCGEKLGALPEECTFTVVVELKDCGEPPIGHPQPWVPSKPSLQTRDKGDCKRIGSDLGGVKTIPIRAVEAGEFILESWIEEGKAKSNYHT